MRFTVSGEQYEYDPNKLMNIEAIALQRATGMRPPEFGKALELGDAIAITGLVWLMWSRNGKVVPFEEVVFDIASIEIEDEDEADADPKDSISKD